VAEHTVKAFDEDITRLRGLIAEMGGLAELSVSEGMEALSSGPIMSWPQVSSRATSRSTQLEAEVDKLAIRVHRVACADGR
jgi:phosphate transport system protein